MFERSFVSVIIPVYNDSQALKKCLEALESQTYPKNLYEVVVVDNNSEEDIRSLVQSFAQSKSAHESHCGSYAARNKGIKVSKGEIIAFTDSDCVPESDWIEKGVNRLLETPNCGLVAGRIELFFKDPDKLSPVELYESFTAFKQKRNVEVNHWGATANVFTYRKVIDTVGAFDEALQSGGDVEWGQRIFAASFAQTYGDDCVVKHPARYSFKQLRKKTIRVTKGRHDILKSADKYPHHNFSFKDDLVSSISRAIRPPVKSAIGILLSSEKVSISQKIQVIIVLVFVRYVSALTKIYVSLFPNENLE